jgi:hypothetical protein
LTTESKVIVIPIKEDSWDNRSRASTLFYKLAHQAKLKTRVGNHGVLVEGTVEQITHGERLVKEAGLQ